ncbi:MAG: peptidylprolyl isomerase [Bacteroidetes bacterium]|nr:peptidylprolyl isomerase [Fibrella sp.]
MRLLSRDRLLTPAGKDQLNENEDVKVGSTSVSAVLCVYHQLSRAKYGFLVWFALLSHVATAQLYSRETNNNTRYTDSTAKVEIESLYKMLQNGYDFSGLAVRYSQDPGSYKVGGELGLSTMRDYVFEYRNVVMGLTVNEISPPFLTEYGYHIVQLIGKKDGLYNTRHILLRTD